MIAVSGAVLSSSELLQARHLSIQQRPYMNLSGRLRSHDHRTTGEHKAAGRLPQQRAASGGQYLSPERICWAGNERAGRKKEMTEAGRLSSLLPLFRLPAREGVYVDYSSPGRAPPDAWGWMLDTQREIRNRA